VSGGGFSSTGLSAEGSWEGLGFGNRRRRFPAGLSMFLQTRGCVKQNFLQRPPTIRFTDSVLRTGFLIIFLRFGGGGAGGGGSGGGGGGDFNISQIVQSKYLRCSKFFFYGRDSSNFLKVLRRWWWRLEQLLKYCNIYIKFRHLKNALHRNF